MEASLLTEVTRNKEWLCLVNSWSGCLIEEWQEDCREAKVVDKDCDGNYKKAADLEGKGANKGGGLQDDALRVLGGFINFRSHSGAKLLAVVGLRQSFWEIHAGFARNTFKIQFAGR